MTMTMWMFVCSLEFDRVFVLVKLPRAVQVSVIVTDILGGVTAHLHNGGRRLPASDSRQAKGCKGGSNPDHDSECID